MTKELAGKILGDLYDAQYEINVAQTAIRAEQVEDVRTLEFNDFYQDLNTSYEELDKVIKRLEPYDK